MNFSSSETALLNRIQRDIPLQAEPFAHLAAELDQSVQDLLSTIERLKRLEVIRIISAIFNTESLGYQTSLIAFEVPEQHIEKAAQAINEHPGVSHNYLRNHRFNIWFTLAVDSKSSIEKTVTVLKELSGADDYLILRNEKLFKIGMMLDVGDGTSHARRNSKASRNTDKFTQRTLNREERESVRLLQKDMPLVPRPFQSLVEQQESFLTEQQLIELGQTLKTEGIMRRYAAVIRHHKAGFTSNAMTVWKPKADADIESVTTPFIQEPTVTHLYLRTVYPGKWEYPLFAMIHAKTDESLQSKVRALALQSDVDDYLVLTSLREFKKKRIAYFSPAFEIWNQKTARSGFTDQDGNNLKQEKETHD